MFQITRPVTNITPISAVWPQNTPFWPALYLPSSGSRSSRLVTTSPIFIDHATSSLLGMLSFQKRTNRKKKLTASATPNHGWIARVAWPPPNRPVSENR